MLTASEYNKNIEKLIEWARAYYVLDNPIASDEEYDKLARSCLAYEKLNPSKAHFNSPNHRIGGDPYSKFEKAKHIERMWSLEDIFNIEELKEWIDKVKKINLNATFTIQPKFDGLSLNLFYQQGNLIRAITRGNGEVGEDVTRNAFNIRSIPLSIKNETDIEIRGEVVIRKKDFAKLNEKRIKANEYTFANPRNAAAGSLKLLDPTQVSDRSLFFIPWGLGDNTLDSKLETYDNAFIESLGFREYGNYTASNIDELLELYNSMLKTRDEFDVPLDGMAIKVNEKETQEALGCTEKFPRWACAFKFPAEEKTTKLLNVELQVGRLGTITPVAILEPVDICGAIISRATLHNFSEIKRLGLKINDEIIIIRSGDVIPKITKALVDRRTGGEIDIITPTNCPVCDSELLQEETLIKCQNLNCKARIVSSISHFASKGYMEIEGLGESIIELLVSKNKINSVLDIYSLTKDDLLDLDSFKDKKISNLVKAIEDSKGTELYKVVAALGIEHIGRRVSKMLCNKFGLGILDLTMEDLISIKGIGIEMANSLLEFNRVNKETALKLIDIIKPIVIVREEALDNMFKGKQVVITGTMSKSRGEIEKILETLGAKVSSVVYGATDYLICGTNPGGKKYDKAVSLNIEIIDEDKIYI